MATYEIIIRNGTKNDKVNKNLANSGEEKEKDRKEATASKSLKAAMKYVATNSVRELVVSKVGATARDSLLQRKINVAMSMGQTALAFMVNPVVGAVVTATSMMSQAIDYNLKLEKQSNRAQRDWQRAGWMNRSRD